MTLVEFCAPAHHLGGAPYSPGGDVVYNKLLLGVAPFERGITEDVARLLIHEFGHEYSPDHLSAQFHEALCRIGAKVFLLARQAQMA